MILVGGNNKYNQIYAGSNDIEICPPQMYEIGENIRSFSTYASHSVKIDDEGQAFVIGNDLKFRIGTPNRKIYTEFTKFTFDGLNEKFITAHCGLKFTLYITESYQLILCSELDVQRTPRFFKLDKKPKSLFGGSEICAIIDENEDIYVINPSIIYSKITKKTTNFDVQRLISNIHLPSPAYMIACGSKMLITLAKNDLLYMNTIDKFGKISDH